VADNRESTQERWWDYYAALIDRFAGLFGKRQSGPRVRLARIAVGFGPVSLATDGRFVWAANGNDSRITRIDPSTNSITHVDVGAAPIGVAYGNGYIWIALAGEDAVVRVDPETCVRDGLRTPVPEPTALCYSEGLLWVLSVNNHLLARLDPEGKVAAATSRIDGRPARLAAGHGSIWVSAYDSGKVLRIDPVSLRVTAEISAGPNPNGVATDSHGVWVAASSEHDPLNRSLHRDDPIWRIDQLTNEAEHFPVGNGPADLVVDGAVVWTVQGLGTKMVGIDATNGKVVHSIEIANQSSAITLCNGALWTAQPFAIGARSTERAPGTVTRIDVT
jgi:DNA-binding beta-propeller fold protein YncE